MTVKWVVLSEKDVALGNHAAYRRKYLHASLDRREEARRMAQELAQKLPHSDIYIRRFVTNNGKLVRVQTLTLDQL